MTPLEIIALIVILFALVKLVVFLISADAWLSFAGRLYVKPQITSLIAVALAAVVLYFLFTSGIGIVEILATWAFLALLLVAGFSMYATEIIDWAKSKTAGAWLREQWLLSLIWLGLIVWGIVALVPR